jgi:hypothetical protein
MEKVCDSLLEIRIFLFVPSAPIVSLDLQFCINFSLDPKLVYIFQEFEDFTAWK